MALIDINKKDEPNVIIRAYILFSQAAREAIKYTDAHLYRESGISSVQLIVLQALDHVNKSMMPSEIAEWTQTERHNITTLIRRMKKDGLITVERNVSNRKMVDVTITDKGREVLRRTMPTAHCIVDQVMKSITEDDAALLEKQLLIMRRNSESGLKNLTGRA